MRCIVLFSCCLELGTRQEPLTSVAPSISATCFCTFVADFCFRMFQVLLGIIRSIPLPGPSG